LNVIVLSLDTPNVSETPFLGGGFSHHHQIQPPTMMRGNRTIRKTGETQKKSMAA
jgi:hypothetical protein